MTRSEKKKKKKQLARDAARARALEAALAHATRAERAARRALKNEHRQNRPMSDSEDGEWKPARKSHHPPRPPIPPVAYPPTQTNSHHIDIGPGHEPQTLRPTADAAMADEIRRLGQIVVDQQDRIDRLEEREKRTADVLEAVCKLALETAQSVGNTQQVAEFSKAMGDT